MSGENTDTRTDEAALTPEPGRAAAPAPEDAESHLDGCDVPIADATPDEDLPVTEGGVA